MKDPKTGEPTGVLKEAAMGLMSKVLPQPTREDRMRAIRRASEEASRLGITSIHEAGTGEAALELFEEVRKAGGLNVRVYAALSARDDMTEADADAFDALRLKYAANPRIKVGAIKVMADGVIEAHTAARLAPYAKSPSSGHANSTPQELQRLVTMMDRRGWQVMTHAIGDGAVRMTLDAYEAFSLLLYVINKLCLAEDKVSALNSMPTIRWLVLVNSNITKGGTNMLKKTCIALALVLACSFLAIAAEEELASAQQMPGYGHMPG